MNLIKQCCLRQTKGIVWEFGTCAALQCYCSNEVNTSIFIETVDTLKDPCGPILEIFHSTLFFALNHDILKELFCLSQQDN